MGRLIDTDEIEKREHDVILGNGAKHRCFDTTTLFEIPEAVVRCKDCLWGKWNQALWDSIYCENIGMDRDLNDYCSRGERIEDG